MRMTMWVLLWSLFAVSSLAAQSPAGDTSKSEEDKVVAVLDGKELTAQDVMRLRSSLPAQYQQHTRAFSHRDFLENYRQLMALAKQAEQDGLPQKEPYRSQLEYNRMLFLAQAYTMHLSRTVRVPSQDNLDYYEANPSEFEEVRVSAIYVDFSADPEEDPQGKKLLSQEEAKAKAEKMAEKLRQGADFAEMARQHSDDVISAEKGGDLGFFNRKSSLPAQLKRTILGLKDDEISDPVEEGGRFYLFTVTERRVRPYRDVAGDVVSKVRGLKLKETLDGVRTSVSIDYKDEDFLNRTPMAPGVSQTVPLNIRTRRGPRNQPAK